MLLPVSGITPLVDCCCPVSEQSPLLVGLVNSCWSSPKISADLIIRGRPVPLYYLRDNLIDGVAWLKWLTAAVVNGHAYFGVCIGECS